MLALLLGDPVASAVMLQNVADLTDALSSLVDEGWAVTPAQVVSTVVR